MNIKLYLSRYFEIQSQSEKNRREKIIQQKSRAQDIFDILSFIQEYKCLPIWFRKKWNIEIPDTTMPCAYASLSPYSQNIKKRNLDSIKQEAEKDIIFQLSQDISLEVGQKNVFYFLYVNDKIGLVNREKKIIIPAEYDYGFLNNDTLFIVIKDGKQWLISIKWQQILIPAYDKITRIYEKDSDSTIKLINNGKEGIIQLEYKEEWWYTIRYRKEPFAKYVRGIEFASTPQYLDWIDENDQLHITALENEKDDLIVWDWEKRRTISWKDKKIFSFLDNQWILREYDWKNWSAITKIEKLWRDNDIVAVDIRNGPYFIYKKDWKYGINKRWLKEILPAIADSIIPWYQTWWDLKFFIEQNGTWWLLRFDWIIHIAPGEYENLWEGGQGFFGKKNGKWHKCTKDENKKEQRDDLAILYLPTDENKHMYIKQSSFKDRVLVMENGDIQNIITDDSIANVLYWDDDESINRTKTVSLRIRTDGERVYIIDRLFINPTIHRAGKDDNWKQYIVVTHTVKLKEMTEEIFIDDLRNKEDLPF
jgi:hypothetical protein